VSGQLFDLVFVIWHHIFSPFPYFSLYLFAVEREKTFISIYIAQLLDKVNIAGGKTSDFAQLTFLSSS
ncbi:hypothetical protein P4531_15035, partial [Geobacillus stearothermophilus]|uniref:hypothetical protein n=1 Tax=Geobacillus stearothermophilus TaxID=1422 RepID=UPI002E1C3AB0|nr:hypothetical protein [Geobacillus stearothermophilus]